MSSCVSCMEFVFGELTSRTTRSLRANGYRGSLSMPAAEAPASAESILGRIEGAEGANIAWRGDAIAGWSTRCRMGGMDGPDISNLLVGALR